ncbi:MAG: aminoacyl-tRNA hydrolase [Treponema sp.]|nr:aminoacyl-tRNA hydrolase [Treponema sp.]
MDTALVFQSILKSARAEFSRSGGKGGQNVNKVNTRVSLRLALGDLQGLHEDEMAQLRSLLASRINGEGELIIHSSEERSQRMNLERAYGRMEALICGAAALKRKRRPSRPSRGAREERLRAKRYQGAKKAQRRYTEQE